MSVFNKVCLVLGDVSTAMLSKFWLLLGDGIMANLSKNLSAVGRCENFNTLLTLTLMIDFWTWLAWLL